MFLTPHVCGKFRFLFLGAILSVACVALPVHAGDASVVHENLPPPAVYASDTALVGALSDVPDSLKQQSDSRKIGVASDTSVSNVVAKTAETLHPELNSSLKSVLYLGGGENSPWFHLGVLYAIEAFQIPVDSVVGTSWGAWIGALWTMGVSLDDIQRMMLDSAVIPFIGKNDIYSKTEIDAFEIPLSPEGIPSLRKRFSIGLDSAQRFTVDNHRLSVDSADIRRSLASLRLQEMLLRQRAEYRIPFSVLTCDGRVDSVTIADIMKSLPLAGNESSGELCPYHSLPSEDHLGELSIISVAEPLRNKLDENIPLRLLKKNASVALKNQPGVVIRPHIVIDSSKNVWIQAGFTAVENRRKDLVALGNRQRDYASDTQTTVPWFWFKASFDSLSAEVHSSARAYWNPKDTGFSAPTNFIYGMANFPVYDSVRFDMQPEDGGVVVDAKVCPILDVAVGGFGSNAIGANVYGELSLAFVKQMEFNLNLAGFWGNSSYGFRPRFDVQKFMLKDLSLHLGFDLLKLKLLEKYKNENVSFFGQLESEMRYDIFMSLAYEIDPLQTLSLNFFFGHRSFEVDTLITDRNLKTRPILPSIRYSLLKGDNDRFFAHDGYALDLELGAESIGYNFMGIPEVVPIFLKLSADARYTFAPAYFASVTVGGAYAVDAYRDEGRYKYPKKFDIDAVQDYYRLHPKVTPWSQEWYDSDLSSHHYATVRLGGGLHFRGFGAWIFAAYFHDYEDNDMATLDVDKLVLEPALRFKYKSLEFYAGMNRVVDFHTLGDLGDFGDYRFFFRVGNYSFF